MTTSSNLTKKQGTASKVRHKLKRGGHETTFYLDKQQITLEHYEAVPLENGDVIVVVGPTTETGNITPIIFENSGRGCKIIKGRSTAGYTASAFFGLVTIGILCLSLSGIITNGLDSLLSHSGLPLIIVSCMTAKISSSVYKATKRLETALGML